MLMKLKLFNMKKGNIIYYALGAAAIWYLYKKYYKPTAPVTDTPIILNQSKLETPAEQVAAPAIDASAAASYNVKYSISGVKYKLPQTI
jgi:hypothetical protein